MGEFEILGSRLKLLRKKMNLNQVEFAELIGISPATLSAYETGAKNPSIGIFKIIAEKCHVSIDWLCGLTEKESYNDEIETYADVIILLNKLLSNKILKAYLSSERDPEYESFGFDDDACPMIGTIAFDNKLLTEILYEWKRYRNVGDDVAMNESINKMWIDQALNKYGYSLKTNEEYDALPFN